MTERDNGEAEIIPVLEERLRVGTRITEGERVVLRKTVSTHEEAVEVPVRRQDVSVERVPLNQVVTAAPSVREEGEWLIVPVLEEVLVVEKRLVLKEELRIRRQERTETARETVPLRTEQVSVERAGSAGQQADTAERSEENAKQD